MKNTLKTNFQVNDRVFSYSLQEWGTIVNIKIRSSNPHPVNSVTYPVKVDFDSGKYDEFTLDGRKSVYEIAPDLFFDEVSIVPPQRPF